MRHITRFICLVPLMLTLSACGTLFSSSEDTIHFESDPVGAKVYLNGQLKGTTPLDVTLERDAFALTTVKMKKEGYKTNEFELQKVINRASFFNLTSIFSWGTDFATGHVMRYSPDSYFIELEREGKQSSENDQRDLKRFVLINYDELLLEISQGQGEHVDGLSRLLGVAASQQPHFVAQLQKELPGLTGLRSPLLSLPIMERAAAL